MLFYLSLLLLLFLFRVFRFLNDSCFFLYISTVTLIFCCSVEFSVFLNINLLYINTSINYFCYLKTFPELLFSAPFLGRSILSLLDRCTILHYQRQKMLIVFKKYPSVFHIAYFPFQFAALSWWRFISTIWWSFAVLSYLKVCHYLGKGYVNWKNLSAGGFHSG